MPGEPLASSAKASRSVDYARVQSWLDGGKLWHPLEAHNSVDLANALAVCAGASLQGLDGDVRPEKVQDLVRANVQIPPIQFTKSPTRSTSLDLSPSTLFRSFWMEWA